MYIFRHTTVFLVLALALTSGVSCKLTNSRIGEIDLIFPHNDTFAPSELTPVVFAIQNPSLIQSLDPILYWSLEQRDYVTLQDAEEASGLYHLSSINMSSSGPYIMYESTHHLDVEGLFQFSWQLTYPDCPQSGEETDEIFKTLDASRRVNSVFFTIKSGASKPDLVTATNEANCPDMSSHVYNITQASQAVAGLPDHESSCVVIPSITPTPSPCNVAINPSAASSISAALTSWACKTTRPQTNSNISCPAVETSRSEAQRSRIRAAWSSPLLGWLAYALA